MSELGFGGRTYSADGPEVWVEPLRHERENGSVGYSLGFPFATLSEYIGDSNDIPESLAEYLSCPKRAVGPELYEALHNALDMIVDASRDGTYSLSEFEHLKATLKQARGEQA